MQNSEDNEYLRLFAQRVRILREEQGISQEELAGRAKLHRTYIGMVERLERNPLLVSIHKIANGLGVHVSELFK
jgi:transcriptional regulator with XRE-family HTH domain